MGEKDFSKNLVKQYKYWSVFAHENQSYLGRCVIWCDRVDALDLTDVTNEEREELFKVLPEIKKAIEDAFGADWMNYSFLGNEMRHLHGHMVPRYSSEREFEGKKYTDELWGKNWRTNTDFVTSEEALQVIKDRIKSFL